MYCTAVHALGAAPQGLCRRHPLGAAGGNFGRWGQQEAILGVREGARAKNGEFGITLVHLRLVERSILVYGKWGQIGDLGGATRGMSFG